MEQKIITFKDGLPGFENHKKFEIIINEDEHNPFHTLKSVDSSELSFIIIDPYIFKPDYDFELKDELAEKLEIQDIKDVSVYSIVTIPSEDYTKITANLLGPLIVNTRNGVAKQIALNDTRYSTKHYILDGSKA